MSAQPIDAVCKKDYYPAYHSSGTRPLKDVIWIVLHDEEALTAKSAAMYFKSPNSGGSAHLCVDDKECYRCLPNDAVAWGAPSANEQGFHIEQAGFARWSTVIWKSHLDTLKRAAYKTALHCKLFGISVRFCKADDLRARLPGITTHREVSKAFGGSHTDPGPGYPIPLFMWLCRHYRNQLG
jgi:hypothetical protein